MNDPMIIAGAAVMVIGAIAAAAVSIISALGKMRSDIQSEMSDISKKTSVIEGHVNSAATRADATRLALEQQVLTFQDTINKLETTAKLLAQSNAINKVPNVSSDSDILIPKGATKLETEELKIIKKDKK